MINTSMNILVKEKKVEKNKGRVQNSYKSFNML